MNIEKYRKDAEEFLSQVDKASEAVLAELSELRKDNQTLRVALADAEGALSQAAAGLPEYIRYSGTGKVEGGYASPGLVRKNPPMDALCISHVVIDEATYNKTPAHQKFGVRIRQAPVIKSKRR